MGIVEILFVVGAAMAILVGVGRAIRWANRQLPSDGNLTETIAALERRVTELEDRVDFAERALTDLRAPEQLPPRS